MIFNLSDRERILDLCGGNELAAQWLLLWCEYCHLIDDLVDGDVTCREELLRSYLLALDLYTHPFFLANGATLKPMVVSVSNAFADSVKWEASLTQWQADVSDVLRHAGSEMLLLVAYLCGGWGHLRRVSGELRGHCVVTQRTQEGRDV